MKKYILCLVCNLAMLSASATVTRSYYQNVNGTSGASLFSTLTTITNSGYHTLGYDGLYTAYRQTDVYPSDSIWAGKLWDTYGGCEFSWGDTGSYRKECDAYNREHSIPQSWWGGGTGTIGCDIFHVIPTDGYVNNRRSNYPYGEVSSPTYQYNGNKLGSSVTSGVGTVFEPKDEFKGDLARGILGTIMKWNASKTMTSGNGSKFFQNSYTASTNYGLTTYAVNLLLKWHRQDPVSRKEIDRNNGIQATQGNRNPFIDFPYLVEYIWGSCAGQTVVLDSLVASFESGFVPGVSNGWGGSSVVPAVPDTVTPSTPTDTTIVTPPDTTAFTFTGVHRGCLDFSTLYSGTGVTPASTYSLCGDSVQITLTDGSNPCKYYTDAIRVYAGGSISFQSLEPMTSIMLTYGSSDNSNEISASCGTWNDPEWTGSSTSVILSIGGSSKHRRISSICVVFGTMKEEPEDPHQPGEQGGPENPTAFECPAYNVVIPSVVLCGDRLVVIRDGIAYDLYGRRVVK